VSRFWPCLDYQSVAQQPAQETFFTHGGGRSQNPRPISCLAPSGPPAKRMNRGYKHGNSFSSRRPLLIILPSPRARAEQYKTYISVYICASGRKYIPTHARRILFPSDADGFGRRVSSDRRWGRKRDRRSIWNYIDQRQITVRWCFAYARCVIRLSLQQLAA